MTTGFNDDALMAYADGHAEDAVADAIETAMDSDPEVRRKVLGFVRSAHRLRAAYQHIAGEAAPDRLVAAVRGAGRDRNLARRRPRQPASIWRMAAGFLVAAVIGGLVGGWGTSWLPSSSRVADIDSQRGVYQAAVDRALEGLQNGRSLSIVFASGDDAELKPVSTFLNDAGEFCREFETRFAEADGRRVVISIACRRSSGGWRIDGAFLGAEPAQDVFRIGFAR